MLRLGARLSGGGGAGWSGAAIPLSGGRGAGGWGGPLSGCGILREAAPPLSGCGMWRAGVPPWTRRGDGRACGASGQRQIAASRRVPTVFGTLFARGSSGRPATACGAGVRTSRRGRSEASRRKTPAWAALFLGR